MAKASDILVVGAGPAGLMAAIAAARRGKRVIVFEAKPRPGLKLLASGGGRCNLTNTLEPEAFMARFGRHGRFMTPALRLLPPDGLRRFLAELGVQTHQPDRSIHVAAYVPFSNREGDWPLPDDGWCPYLPQKSQ